MTATGRESPAVGRFDEIVVDCRDPATLATFWAGLLGVEPKIRDATWATVREPDGGLVVAFQEVPSRRPGRTASTSTSVSLTSRRRWRRVWRWGPLRTVRSELTTKDRSR